MQNKKTQTILVLPDIRSALNVGAIFRTADAVGVDKVYLTGYTPLPTDKFGRVQKDIKKAALGAEEWIPWEYVSDLNKLVNQLKKARFKVVAIEQDKNSVSYRKIKKEGKMAIILGSEISGLDKKILKKCDVVAEIPMCGKKESLNVSVAAGVALFQILGI